MTDQRDNSAIIEEFGKYLKDKGKRKTPERFMILEKALDFKKQFTIEDLCKAMDSDVFRVSLSTLYNTVDLLVEAKILRRISTAGNAVAFERVEQLSFIHLKCEVCGKVKLVKDTNFMAYMNARKFAAFTTSYYNLMVYGTCNDCARKLKRNRGKNKQIKNK